MAVEPGIADRDDYATVNGKNERKAFAFSQRKDRAAGASRPTRSSQMRMGMMM